MSAAYDLAVIGGGILGCAAALQAASGGMRCIVIDSGDIGQGASGVNAGTLSLQIKRVKLMPYAIAGHREWVSMGDAVGFRRTGGYTLAFNKREAEMLRERMTLKREAGAPIRFVSRQEIAAAEPALSPHILAGSYCAEDGYANSSLTGQFYRKRLRDAGVTCLERVPVQGIEPVRAGFILKTPAEPVRATRILLAAGGWLRQLSGMLGAELPVRARVNTVSVTERMPPVFSSVIGHATGLLTTKQKPNGTILIGGGWQGKGKPGSGRGEVDATNVTRNLALARFAIPALAHARLMRCWTGFEANTPDFYPLAGALPGAPGIFVLGCVRGGYTIGPYLGRLMGDFILGREPELPLFDPGRNFTGAQI